MSRLNIVFLIISIMLMGFIRVIFFVRKIGQQDKFAEEFLEKLTNYVKSRGSDETSYIWMVYNSTKMQRDIGELGILKYKPAGASYFINDYEVIVNSLSELKRHYSDMTYSFLPRLANETAEMIRETLIRYLGDLDNSKKELIKKLMNPLYIFQEGIQSILLIPFYLFGIAGLGKVSNIYKLSQNKFFKLISGIVFIITFISAIVSLIAGWPAFINFIDRYIKIPH
jgi:hypothetical protein